MLNIPAIRSLQLCRRTCRLLPLLTLMLVLPGIAPAGTMDPSQVAEKLQKTYEAASNVVAAFQQTTTMKSSSRMRQGSGTMIFSKPGRMRWDYKSPDYQVIICDGETISMYFAKSEQMIVSSAKEYLRSDVTYSFFAGNGNILQDFEVAVPDFANTTDNTYLITLTPRVTHPHVSLIYAWVSRETFLIKHLQIIDHFGTVTDLFFQNIHLDADQYEGRKITDDLFHFTPPSNTEIIEQR